MPWMSESGHKEPVNTEMNQTLPPPRFKKQLCLVYKPGKLKFSMLIGFDQDQVSDMAGPTSETSEVKEVAKSWETKMWQKMVVGSDR